MSKTETSTAPPRMVRPPAEVIYAEELAALTTADNNPRPRGWRLSPRAVRQFIVGADSAITHTWQGVKKKTAITQKFYGDDALVERCIVTLLGNRGLLLVGEPGTAKSMLSELLSAAISGNSLLTIQGTAGTTDDQIKYSWNYALLLAEGPTPRALVASPLYSGMKFGALVRFEEITRCQPEIQDTLVSLLSDKCIQVPELPGADAVRFAEKGFNIIATANLRDRGVHEMSSALKRRFNFETVAPLADKAMELRLVKEQTESLLHESAVKVDCPTDVLELLVATFNDLRHGRTDEGTVVEKPSTVMSTAEAVAVSHSAALDAAYFGNGRLESGHVARQLLGTVLKDNPDDLKKLKHYFEVVVKARGKANKNWQQFYEAKKWLHG
ncbi:MAG TPA: AAA family ATPase [Verrucomicrobiota bacterium]|nr:AAA family ATPase [Verrucomicrobiales bacterium]HRI11502.1 AAA family ATPase [Verrucomicrobiota bacterium]